MDGCTLVLIGVGGIGPSNGGRTVGLKKWPSNKDGTTIVVGHVFIPPMLLVI